MNAKGIGPHGLGVKGHNGFWVGDASTVSPLKLKDACYRKVKASYKVFPLLTLVELLLNVEKINNVYFTITSSSQNR